MTWGRLSGSRIVVGAPLPMRALRTRHRGALAGRRRARGAVERQQALRTLRRLETVLAALGVEARVQRRERAQRVTRFVVAETAVGGKAGKEANTRDGEKVRG